MIYVKQNDRRPVASTVLTRGTVIVDLTTATSVTFKMRPIRQSVLTVDAAAVIDPTPTTGAVTYQWAVGDTDIPGSYKAEWEVLWADGTTETFPTVGHDPVIVTDDLDGSS